MFHYLSTLTLVLSWKGGAATVVVGLSPSGLPADDTPAPSSSSAEPDESPLASLAPLGGSSSSPFLFPMTEKASLFAVGESKWPTFFPRTFFPGKYLLRLTCIGGDLLDCHFGPLRHHVGDLEATREAETLLDHIPLFVRSTAQASLPAWFFFLHWGERKFEILQDVFPNFFVSSRFASWPCPRSTRPHLHLRVGSGHSLRDKQKFVRKGEGEKNIFCFVSACSLSQSLTGHRHTNTRLVETCTNFELNSPTNKVARVATKK